MDRHGIIGILNEIGMLLEIKGESFFKSKAYYDAARTLELMDEGPAALVREGRLKAMKGFGDALTKKITELVETGGLKYYDELKREVPAGLIEMLRIQGFGPKKIRAVHESLGISTIEGLKSACLENKLAPLKGFGDKTQAKILEGIENLGKYTGQYLYPFASALAEKIVQDITASGLVTRCSVGGSVRRKKEVSKDIDILAGCSNSKAVMDFFTSHPLVEKVVSKGETKSSVTLMEGINADLRAVEDFQFPYALHHFTGSKEHNTAMRQLAKQNGMKMNEYGLFKGESELIECKSEAEIFKALGMQYIPPELRENNGEIEAALKGSLPALIELSDIKGLFHIHSRYSDGSNSIEELIVECIKMGYSYLGISDHSKSAFYAGGLKLGDIKRQHEEIELLKGKYPDFTVLKGIELEILPDGSLDYDDETLELFDFTIASVHSSFRMDSDRMTERVIKAIKSNHVDILGHPTGRILLSREPYSIDMDEIIKAAASEKVIIEINASPHRLDLDWRFCKKAREAGCKFAIAPDAHSLTGLYDVMYGVNNARKGWLTADDVINTKSIAFIKNLL